MRPAWLVAALAVAAGALVVRFGTAAGSAPPPPAHGPAVPPTVPTIITSELRFATTPAPGVWAELMLILDNPLPAAPNGATRTLLLVPGSLLDDYGIRDTEPALLAEPIRLDDGRYVLSFPPPLAQTLNWYRLRMEVRRARPRSIEVTLALEPPRFETRPTGVRVVYADREADPFKVVPERLVGWLPARAGSALPLLAGYTIVVAALVAGGCAAAFRAVRR